MLVAFGIQPAMRMRHIAICDLSSSTVFFPNYHKKRHDFRKTIIEYKICSDFLYKFA